MIYYGSPDPARLLHLTGWILLAALFLMAVQMDLSLPLARMQAYPEWMVLMVFAFAMILCGLTWLPAEACALAIGAWYGPLVGFWVIWGSAMMAALVAYGLARYLPYPFWNNKYWNRLEELSRSRGMMSTLILVRLVPLVPFFAINLGAGWLGVPFRTYLWSSALGMVPACLVLGLIGSGFS